MLLLALSSCNKSDKDEDEYRGNGGGPAVTDSYMLVCQHVSDVSKEASKYFKSSKSISELKKYASDLKQLKYVEDVYFTNSEMYIEVKDFGSISYTYLSDEEQEPDKWSQMITRQMASASRAGNNDTHLYADYKTAVVVNQQFRDESRGFCKDIMTATRKMLEAANIEVTPENNPQVSFFNDAIYNYDIVFILTHGGYDPKQKLHWLLTSEVPSSDNREYLEAEGIFKYKGQPRDKVSFGSVKETRDGVETVVSYAKVSEKFIAESLDGKSFPHKGKAIVFNSACKSMMGPGENPNLSDTISYSLAKAFADNGAGIYMGYDQSNGVGRYAHMNMVAKMVSCMSIEDAYNQLPFRYRHQHYEKTEDRDEYWADLIAYYPKMEKACIIKPTMDKEDDQSTDNIIKFVLKGKSVLYPELDKEYSSGINKKFYFDYSKYRYGFEISESENFDKPKKLNQMSVGNTGCTLSNNKVEITQTVTNSDLKPNTTYYYRTFFSSNTDTYYSDSRSFTTKAITTTGNTDLPDVPGSDF